MDGKVVLVGAFDTKGEEYLFVKNILEESGVSTLTVNTGVLDKPVFTPDISAEDVAKAGKSDLGTLIEENDRGKAVAVMTRGAYSIMEKIVKDYQVIGVFGMGGTAGTTVAASAMQAVPVGVLKILVSTVASGNTRPYIGVKDICMMYSVIDIAGINSLSNKILRNAANALVGVANATTQVLEDSSEKPMVGMTMFGVTTPCCNQIRQNLEQRGYDLLVFHATGTGGMAMEELIKGGFIKGVVDVTTTELADYLVGGIFSAGPDRLLAAGEAGIPQVVSVGALDMVNFGPPESIPDKFLKRQFYQHNPTTTLMRTTVEENAELGRILAGKANQSKSPITLIFPKGGVSLLDTLGQDFNGPEQREVLLKELKENLRKDIPLIEVEEDINDPKVANYITDIFIDMMEQKK